MSKKQKAYCNKCNQPDEKCLCLERTPDRWYNLPEMVLRRHKSLLKAQREEMIKEILKCQEEYYGSGNGRRLLLQLENKLKNL